MFILPFFNEFEFNLSRQKSVFRMKCQRFAFKVSKTIRFLALTWKNFHFVLFPLFSCCYWTKLVLLWFHSVWRKNKSKTYCFDIETKVKISFQHWFGFMHVDITIQGAPSYMSQSNYCNQVMQGMGGLRAFPFLYMLSTYHNNNEIFSPSRIIFSTEIVIFIDVES
jgi:hypothetical protein